MRLIVVSLLLLAFAAGAPAQAAHDGEVLLLAAESISAEEAGRLAKEQYGGRVLSVDLVTQQGEDAYYRVKLISEGTVRVVRVAAER